MTVPQFPLLGPAELMPLFSTTAIPYTGHRGAGKCKWFRSDNEQHYRQNPHPEFGPDDIEYAFNQRGYRCSEFDTRDSFDKNHLHLLTLGESHAFGMGIPLERTYGHLVAQKLQAHTGREVQHWNLSQGGISAEFIARVLPSALAVLRPNFVILNFPHRNRREYLFEDGNYLTCFDGDQLAGSSYTLDRHEAVLRAHQQHAHAVSNTFSQWKLFIVCQRHLQAHKVMWVAQAGFGLPQRFNQYIAMQNFAPTHIMEVGKEAFKNKPGLRLARDGKHAGIGPHAGLADDMYQLFLREYQWDLQQLKAGHA